MIDEQRPMTVEYAKLSVYAGMLAGTADQHLGGNTFITLTRFQGWNLSARMLVELTSAAMTLGVPEVAIAVVEAIVGELFADANIVRALIAFQAGRDRGGAG